MSSNDENKRFLWIDPDPAHYFVHSDSPSEHQQLLFQMYPGERYKPWVRRVDGTEMPPLSKETTDRVDADARDKVIVSHLASDDPERWRQAGEISFSVLNDVVHDGKLRKVPSTAVSHREGDEVFVWSSLQYKTPGIDGQEVWAVTGLVWTPGAELVEGQEWHEWRRHLRITDTTAAWRPMRPSSPFANMLDTWQNERCSTIEISSSDGEEARQLMRAAMKHDTDDLVEYVKKLKSSKISAIKQIDGLGS